MSDVVKSYIGRGSAHHVAGEHGHVLATTPMQSHKIPRNVAFLAIYQANPRGHYLSSFGYDARETFLAIYQANPRGHYLSSFAYDALREANRVREDFEEEFKNIPFHIRLMGGFRGSRDTYNRYVKNYNKMVSIISTAVAEGDITEEEGRFVLNQCRK